MRHLTATLFAVASLVSSAAGATSTLQTNEVGFACSDVLSLTDEGGFVLGCSGDLRVQGSGDHALLSHGTSITLRASTSLTIEDLRILAPTIVLEAPQISLGTDVLLDAPSGAGSGQVVLNTRGPLRPPAGVDPNRVTVGGGGTVSITPGADLRVSDFRDQDTRLVFQPAALPVPEPSGWALLLGGLGMMACVRLRRA